MSMKASLSANAKLLFAILLVGVGVAFTYTVFEQAISLSLDLIWNNLLHTNTHRLLILPLIFGFTLIFFWLRHTFDRSDKSEGLGSTSRPTLANFGKILLVGYFSLLAGASLGPEAILVPASMLLGAYIGNSLFARKQETSFLAGMGIVALFTAFFHSYIIGILAIFLVAKQAKSKPTLSLLLFGAVTAGVTYLVLGVIDSKEAVTLPSYSWHINLVTILYSALLIASGYLLIRLLAVLDTLFGRVYILAQKKSWWQHAIIAAIGLTTLYLLGGPLVQFTGNHSIVPLFEQSATLGMLGIIWVIVIKVAAMAWSKAIGYRGGMIFPTIFLAAALVALLQLYVPSFNAIYGLIAVLIGAFIANSKTGVLA